VVFQFQPKGKEVGFPDTIGFTPRGVSVSAFTPRGVSISTLTSTVISWLRLRQKLKHHAA
jgi:hypothetical protein